MSHTHHELEEGNNLNLDFKKLQKAAESDVVPAVIQDADTLEVLILAYVNEQALKQSLETGIATFYSTSRKEIWVKGATSGQHLELIEIRVNCEQNSLLFRVRSADRGACHTKNTNGNYRKSCYYRKINKNSLEFLEK